MKRSERLFAVAEVLRGRRTGITAEELAERFGISVRTVMRDLDALRAAHLPINGERGRGGGLHLDKSYAMPPVSFTAREALVLLVLLRFAKELRAVPFLATLASAGDKLRAALPVDVQRQLVRLQSSVSFVGVPALPVDDDVRRAVEQAFFESTPLRFGYQKGETAPVEERHVRIDSVVLERAETLLNCVDLALLGDDAPEPAPAHARRQFRLHRIRWAQPA